MAVGRAISVTRPSWSFPLADLVGVRDQGHLRQEVREGAFGRGALSVLSVTPPASAAGGIELPRHRHELVQVLDPAYVLGIL